MMRVVVNDHSHNKDQIYSITVCIYNVYIYISVTFAETSKGAEPLSSHLYSHFN